MGEHLTNFDMIKNSKNAREMGEFLCAEFGRYFIENWSCDKCPFSKMCEPKENGITKWLKK